MSIQIHPDAKLVDIRIVEVPYAWKGLAPEREIGSKDNTQQIRLVHEPTGILFTVEVKGLLISHNEIAEARGRAKLTFINELHGQAWLND